MKNKEKLLEQERAFDAKIKNAGKVFTCNDSKLTERMMRCGIEARVFCPDNEDELRHIALVTLKMDAVNSLPSNAGGNATERSEGRVDHNVGRMTPRKE